ncbi:hypothetical protein [Geodermatophilus sp. FMUSA9-8]|uniref:hypothetical protein n=1 Tax=Geodermatophilus sp. FMUSA9-8 TaxID=3120155 RepID=UPI00300A6D7C
MASREDIAEQLWLRDEPELARAVLDVDDAVHRRIMVVAARPLTGGFRHSLIDELLVAAAVRVLDGRRRPRRWEARSEDLLPDFWREVGPEQDRRSGGDGFSALVQRVIEEQ